MKNALLVFILAIGTPVFGQTTRIAFGSCARQTDSLTIFDTILNYHPSHFIFLGDNMYGDTRDTSLLKIRYQELANHPGFQHLMDSSTVWATWDDHDYGENDAGRSYPMKKESKEIFLDFFKEPEDSERRKHDGIYTSYYIKDSNLTVQVIVLDTRTFRDDLKKYRGAFKKDTLYQYGLNYRPGKSKKINLLGAAQWNWLEEELKKPADIRIVCSSIQLAHSYNGYESWTNFPSELVRFQQLVQKTKANGLFVISGDVHYAEISVLKSEYTYPIYDFTSSGLSSKWHLATPNTNRTDGPIMQNNFGLIEFNKTADDCEIQFRLIDLNNQPVLSKTILLSQLRFK